MLGRMQMTVGECIEACQDLATRVFSLESASSSSKKVYTEIFIQVQTAIDTGRFHFVLSSAFRRMSRECSEVDDKEVMRGRRMPGPRGTRKVH